MIPKLKKKVLYRKEKVFRKKESDHDFLKNWSIVKKWAVVNNNLKPAEIDMLLFLYSEKLFTRQQFRDFSNFLSWDRQRFNNLLKNDWIYVWRKGAMHEANLYDVSYKGKKLVSSMYRILLGLDPIPSSPRRNVAFRSTAPFAQKTLALAITKFNSDFKERKQRPSPELR